MGGWKVMLIWLPELMDAPSGEQAAEGAGGAGADDRIPAGGSTDARAALLPTILSRTQLVKVPALAPGKWPRRCANATPT
jgi:hypothetical protein